MSHSTFVRQLESTDISELIEISNSLFGDEFITDNEFQSYLSEDSKMGLLAIHKNQIAGFLLIHICTPEMFLEYAVSEEEWFRSHFSNIPSIGVYKSIGISEKFQRKGIGRLLTQKGVELMRSKAKSAIAICWEQKETPLLRLLEGFNFHFERKIDHFWAADSLRKKYSCGICGAPPCNCNAFIYALNFD